MTHEKMKELFADTNDEFLKFDRVQGRLSKRPDIHAFLLLDSIVPHDADDIIACAEHDEIWLDVDVNKLASLATEEQIVDLIRCGVRYDRDNDSLAMFV